MPKNKKPESSSDSDSGPEDRAPKSKSSAEPAAKRPKFSDDNGEPFWELDKNRYVKIRDFKGKVYVDIREYYEKDGKLLPGKKGISLNGAQFKTLADVFDKIKAEVDKQ